ncbi:MAG: nucleoside 2-deoxyribosyltransferase [bacterium]|nr:nucleoside 2-deoxyribosyltransferase [bacterium]
MVERARLKVYLSVPIVNFYDSEVTSLLGKILTDLGFDISSPWVLSGKDVGMTPEEIFYRDINAVKESDILLAEISKPSHGVGMEIMQAYISNKKIILVARENSSISFLVKGIPNAILLEYKNYIDLEAKLRKILKEMIVV